MVNTAPCGGTGEILTASRDYCVSSTCSPGIPVPPLKGPYSCTATWSMPSTPPTLPHLRPYPGLVATPTTSAHSKALCEADIGVFNVVFLQGNIRVCQGCRNNYQKSPSPPNNIYLQHPEWREFMPPGAPNIQTKWGNAYYHCNRNCVLARWPTFSNSLIKIDLFIQQKLLPVHKEHLHTHFGIFLN